MHSEENCSGWTNIDLIQSGGTRSSVARVIQCDMRCLSFITWGCLSLILIGAVMTPGPIPFFPSARLDADYISLINHGTELGFQPDDSFYHTASFYRLIADYCNVLFFIGLIGVGIYWQVYRAIGARNDLLIATLWGLVALIQVMNAPGKDLLTMMLVSICVIVIDSLSTLFISIVLVIIAYSLYAIFFRNYYILCLALSLSAFFALLIKRKYRPVFALGCAIGLLLFCSQQITALELMRDQVNVMRQDISNDGLRSAFQNPLPTDIIFGQILNYCYAIIRLCFPFFWGWSIKDIIFSVYTLTLGLMIWRGLSSPNVSGRLAGSLILGTVLTSFFFEPDVGSFARHSSTLFPYLSLLLKETT